MEALPDGRPPSTAVLPAQHGMMWHPFQREVFPEKLQERLELPERGIEQLAYEEGDHQVPFRHWPSASALMALPERKRISQLPYALHREVDISHQPPGVSSGTRYQVVA